MPKAPTKRKSDSVLFTATKKSKKIKQQRRGREESEDGDESAASEDGDGQRGIFVTDAEDENDEDDENDDDEDETKKGTMRGRKSDPGPGRAVGKKGREREDEEYVEDVGRLESQEFLMLVQAEHKKKVKEARETREFLKGFEETVASAKEDAHRMIEKLNEEADNQDSIFNTSWKSAYIASSSQHRTFGSSLFEKSKLLTSSATTLLSTFEHTSAEVEKLFCNTEAVGNEWRTKDAELAALVTKGRDVGLRRCREVLEGREGGEEESNGGDEGREFFVPVEGEGGGLLEKTYGWGKLAKKLEKPVFKIIATASGE